jgi:hypothetical protein
MAIILRAAIPGMDLVVRLRLLREPLVSKEHDMLHLQSYCRAIISVIVLCVNAIPIRAAIHWYSGDFDGQSGYVNRFDITGLSVLPEAKMCENFIVTDPAGWNVTEVWSNNFNLGGTVTQAEWSIRSGMAPGNGGTILFSGTSPVSVTPTGRFYQLDPMDPPNLEYTFMVSGVNAFLPPGEYWLNVTPYAQSDVLISSSTGSGAVGIPPANDVNALWWWSTGGHKYDNTMQGFSMGVGENIAQAQLKVSIDVDPAAGIQDAISVSPGDMVTASIVVDVGASGLSSYGISAQFDTTELDLKGASPAVELLPAGFTFNITPGVQGFHENIGGGLGDVQTFEAATFAAGPVNTSFEIGRVNFIAVAPSGTTTDIDILPGEFNVGIDAFFDNAGMRVFPTFVGGSVHVGTPCDFDGDGTLGLGDIDLLLKEVKAGTNNPAMDLNNNGVVNLDDICIVVTSGNKLNTYIGDSNLDKEFSSADFVAIFIAGQYEDSTAMNSTWATGDWNGDGDFTSSDLVFAFQKGGYEQGSRTAQVIPEPSGFTMLLSIVIPTLACGRLR